ncbi:hypothetical protein ACLKA6_013366 [Drosophila palustris]
MTLNNKQQHHLSKPNVIFETPEPVVNSKSQKLARVASHRIASHRIASHRILFASSFSLGYLPLPLPLPQRLIWLLAVASSCGFKLLATP